jgi:hypothetical protein
MLDTASAAGNDTLSAEEFGVVVLLIERTTSAEIDRIVVIGLAAVSMSSGANR